MVIPSTLSELRLNVPSGQAGVVEPVLYASAKTTGWETARAALAVAGYDVDDQQVLSAHLKVYRPLTARIVSGADAAPGSSTTLTVVGRGGVAGGYAYRFVKVSADGATEVLQDWSDAASYATTVPTDGATIRAEVRDASYFTAVAEQQGGPQIGRAHV